MAIFHQTVLKNPWVKQKPTERQSLFLLTPCLEALYGGAAGGGKSSAILMAAAQFVDQPGYAALILRRTFADLSQPDALIDRSKKWWMGTEAHWNPQQSRWTFPSGATVTFGYLDRDDAVYQYQSSAFQFIAVDELTQHTEWRYRYMFSRLRRLEGSQIPLRMRSGSNPGGAGHAWVKKRWGMAGKAAGGRTVQNSPERIFIPARKVDNPYLDQDAYTKSLGQLDPVTRAQLDEGDWDAFKGGRFRSEWFRRYVRGPERFTLEGRPQPVYLPECMIFVIVDPAASEKETADNTAIGVFALTPRNDLLVLDVLCRHLDIEQIPVEVARICARWKPSYVGVEDVGFQVGILKACRRTPGIPTVRGLCPEGKGKLVRATPAIIRCEAGQLFLPQHAPWLEEYEAELVQFTGDEKEDAYDDQVDMTAYAVQEVDKNGLAGYLEPAEPKVEERVWEPRGNLETSAQRRGLYGRR